ncbi:hypothetical protein, partial [Paenibacillus periandrae]|uniref:hypothetical protein n=1 Tax=Paenibacillus periandrae TaxID=1761741 RepID=UPI001F09E5BD
MVWDNLNQFWQGSQPWLVVASNWQHPSPNTSSVRKWVAPQTGLVRITGNAAMLWGSGGNGVTVKILHNSALKWSTNLAYNDLRGTDTDVSVG